jgi:hypothetical protein
VAVLLLLGFLYLKLYLTLFIYYTQIYLLISLFYLSYKSFVTGSDTHIYYLLTELLWEQYCRLFGQHPKVRKQIADTRPRDGSGQTRLGSGWAGLLGGLGHEKYRALARRSWLARSAPARPEARRARTTR